MTLASAWPAPKGHARVSLRAWMHRRRIGLVAGEALAPGPAVIHLAPGRDSHVRGSGRPSPSSSLA